MDLNNFTTIARAALTEAQNYALAHFNPSLTDLHLLSSLLKNVSIILYLTLLKLQKGYHPEICSYYFC